MHRFLFTLLLALGFVVPVSAENWERFRGPNGTGVAPDKNIPVKFDAAENVLWKLALPGLGNSSPIIWGKHLFLQTASADGSQRLLLCIDADKGKELWSRGIPAAPAPKGLKHPKNTLASATPVTDGEAVFVPFWDGKSVFMVAYTFKGDLLWNKPLGHWISQHGTGASPILYKDKLIFANDMDKEHPQTKAPVNKPSTLYAFNKKTGDIVWEVPREAERACYSAPFILENRGAAPELIVTSTTSIMSYNPDDGAPNWRWNWTFRGKLALRTVGSTLYLDGMLFACSGDGSGERLLSAVTLNGLGKSARPKLAWENAKEFPYVPCLLSRGPHVYFINDGGFAGCFVAKTGKKVWFERLANTKTITASPLLIDDKIYVPSEEGDVHVIAATPTAFQPIAQNPMGEVIRATPAVADGRLYIRGQNHLFCIGRKE
jgi:outer membrane protein assembly factor BamB